MDGHSSGPDEIRRLVRRLGEAGGHLRATHEEIAQLRSHFGERVLRAYPDEYIMGKYAQHVENDEHWPADTTPDEYLESLRQTVLDPGSAIYVTDAGSDGEWSIYFVGRVRRAWRGPGGSSRLAVIFNAKRHILVTGFQPSREDAYIERQGGFWLHRP